MRGFTVSLLVALVVQAGGAAAGDRGAGIILGSPTGLSAKWPAGQARAWAAAVGWDIGGDGFFYAHLDYLRHNREVVRKMNLEAGADVGRWLFYYGPGVRAEAGDDSRLGARLPLGLEYFLADAPLAGFVEAVPLLELLPKTAFRLQGGIGLRYLF